ncbi:MAG: ATP-grasp domain-containing protein [Frankia sp.]|nr:ATP-grasp domain-containing protein [Frankia sp.]
MTAVLVANRGEIAVRVVTACRRLGLSPVVAVSAADRDSLAARLADRAVCLGPARAADSYLRTDLLVQAALGVDARLLHPGYGFASERPELAAACAEHGIAFVGPRPETLRVLGDKLRARQAAAEAGLPVAPGAVVAGLSQALAAAAEIGYPVLVKAVHGGGGRGITLARDPAELARVLPVASAEAQAGFGAEALYLERWFPAARHVEVQVFGDGEGGVVVLGERDCSVQRRHQKLLEECPAPNLSAGTRALLRDGAARLASRLGYRGAGTVEFLVAGDGRPDGGADEVAFLEVNARIQVEHPVTEEAYGVDLVAAQLLAALGEPTGLPAAPGEPSGHVLECRLAAEDPGAGFRPVSGRVSRVRLPRGPGLRVDTHLHDGCVVPPYYDSLLAKIIVRAHSRATAIESMRAALAATEIEGVPTTAAVHQVVLDHPDFRAGRVTTRWLESVWPPTAGTDGRVTEPSPGEQVTGRVR